MKQVIAIAAGLALFVLFMGYVPSLFTNFLYSKYEEAVEEDKVITYVEDKYMGKPIEIGDELISDNAYVVNDSGYPYYLLLADGLELKVSKKDYDSVDVGDEYFYYRSNLTNK